jgi:hypothetical protein
MPRPRTYPEGTTLVTIDTVSKREVAQVATEEGTSQTEQMRRAWQIYDYFRRNNPSFVRAFFGEERED